jgi:hypothetical protein
VLGELMTTVTPCAMTLLDANRPTAPAIKSHSLLNR